jgi:hypothetical protein
MLDDYQARFYGKLWERSQLLITDDYRAARALTVWKARVTKAWEAIELIDLQAPDTFNRSLPLGAPFEAKVVLHLQELSPEDIGIEVVFYKRISEEELELIAKNDLALESHRGAEATFSCHFNPKSAGVFEYGFRVFPQHPLLPHRQDFGLVRWL